MADVVKNIKFNFDDSSLRKGKQLYDDFIKSLINRSSIYGQNSLGNSNIHQQRFLKEEIEGIKQLTEARRKEFEERIKQFEILKDREIGLRDSFKKGNITSGFLQTHLDKIDDQRKDLLKGTGYRKENTFLKGEGGAISQEQQHLKSLEKLLENSNVILRNILSNDKEEALKLIKTIESNEKATPEEILAAQKARGIISNEKSQKGLTAMDVMGSILSAQNIIGIMDNAKGIATAQSPLQAASSFQRTMSGGVNAIGDAFGPIGGLIARSLTTYMDMQFENKMQSFQAQQEYDRVRFANRALMGGGLINPASTTHLGLGYNDFTPLIGQAAIHSGTSKNAETNARNALILEKSLGVGQNVTQAVLELTRSNKESDKNLINIISGISGSRIFAGGNDRAFLGEFITKNFAGLQKELLKNQSSVTSGTVMGILNTFDSIGGQFAARHQNSPGLINQIHNNLANPQGDTMDALTFTALRQAMPTADIFTLQKERQKGIGSAKYVRSMMNLSDMWGDGPYAKLQFAQMMGLGDNLDAAEQLWGQRGKLKNLSDKDLLKAVKGVTQLEDEGSKNVTDLEKFNANFGDKVIQGKDVGSMIKEAVDKWGQIMEGRTFVYDVTTKQITERFNPIKNDFRTAQEQVKEDWKKGVMTSNYLLK